MNEYGGHEERWQLSIWYLTQKKWLPIVMTMPLIKNDSGFQDK